MGKRDRLKMNAARRQRARLTPSPDKLKKARAALKVLSPTGPPPVRTCGECDVCCTAIGVPDIGKPEYQPCPHQLAGRDGRFGCAIHDGPRPPACGKFKCGYLEGLRVPGVADGSLRPDRAGVLLWRMRGTIWGNVLCANECAPDGLERPVARLLVEFFSRRELVLVITNGGRSLRGPRDQVTAAVGKTLEALTANGATPNIQFEEGIEPAPMP